ncbi:exported hypothetical protein [Candidatus Sulfopaludibacter sp. SbA4]|nr:exported hypothetical protein [Candidatus Sulfopaludibacter sp. SbA4]
MKSAIRRLLWVLAALPLGLAAGPVSYDIVYVRAPRAGDSNYIRFPDVFFATAMPAGSDLMLLHPDGTQETLFAAGNGAVLDPAVSFDAQWVFFSYIPDVTSNGINPQRGLAYGGADIYKINIATRQVVQLTQQVWTPPTGSANWSTNLLSPSSPNSIYLGFGTFNLGACPLPGGKVMFVSSRDGYLPNKEYTNINLRLYIMDDTGLNVEPVGHLNIGSALHPTVLMDGRVMFASFEAQGERDQRNWSLWAIWPDGRVWQPLMSAMEEAPAFHFQAQLSDGRVAFTWYYNLNDNGFGTILALNPQTPPGTVPFGSPNADDASNPAVRIGLWPPNTGTPLQPRYTSFPFSPPGLTNLTAFSYGFDGAASYAQDGGYAGKATHPAAAPNDDMLLVWTPGVEIKNDPNYNELQPKALVPYSAIYGIAQPAALPYLPNDGTLSPLLPAGTPFGLIGTSSLYNRNTTPGYGAAMYNGLDPFNTDDNGASPNWVWQGADDGLYTNDDIYAVRILAMEGVANRSYPNGGDPGFQNFSDKERLRILGEIPVRKAAGVVDAQGNPDTSFLAKVPADTPISFQTLDKNGLVLNMAQTWHMVRPGEVRNNCGGCHAHNQVPLDFSGTAAAQSSYQVADLTTQTPLLTKDSSGNTTVKLASGLVVDVEYYKDIKPLLQRSCVQCHSIAGNAAAGLVLDDTTLVNGYDNTFNRLANDSSAQWGIPPVISDRQWRQTNASRYVRAFQSRRSLLAWKVFGQRLDGWTNADHPTESTPGVASTLPPGSDPNMADIDYLGTIMPPPNSGVPPLSDDEKLTIARWIDLGAPITEQGDPTYKGYFADEIKPTVALSSPRSGLSAGPLVSISIGMFDAYSGINASSLSVTTNFPVNGLAAGTELGASFTQTGPSIWTLALGMPVTSLPSGHIVVRVKDNGGNYTTVDRWFSIGTSGPPPSITVTPAAVTLGPSGTQQFTATGGAVVWSIAPATGAGTITSAGLYTAPASIAAQQNVTVTATSSGDQTQFATATVTLKPPPTFSISGTISPVAAGSGALAKLAGGPGGSTTADTSGNFSFSGLPNGTYTITPSKSGYSFTPASQGATVNGANVTGLSFTGQAAGGSGTIATDVTVSRDAQTASTTITSPAFSTAHAGELLLAFLATDYRSGTNTTVKSVTGAGLTWVLVARTNVQSGTAEVWRAFAPAVLSNVFVKATLSQSVVSSMTVVSFAGMDATGTNGSGAIGKTASGNARTGAPTASLVTTRNNSWVWGVGNDYDNSIGRTVGSGQSLVHQDLSSTGDTYWVQRQNAATALSGTTVVLNDTAPATDRYNLTIVEILAAK